MNHLPRVSWTFRYPDGSQSKHYYTRQGVDKASYRVYPFDAGRMVTFHTVDSLTIPYGYRSELRCFMQESIHSFEPCACGTLHYAVYNKAGWIVAITCSNLEHRRLSLQAEIGDTHYSAPFMLLKQPRYRR